MAARKSKPLASPTSGSKKRQATDFVTTTPLRQSKRAKSASGTPTNVETTLKKSPYFEAASEAENEESGYEDEDASVSAVSTPPESEEEDNATTDFDSEEDQPRKRKAVRKSGGGTITTSGKATKGKELWRPGVKLDSAPGEEVFIKLPKARLPGKTPYKDDQIHPNTMLFLADLKKNNDREWLKMHDADYRQSKKDFDSFVECLTEKIIEADDTIPELPPKDLTFRIYRDIRFSPDPTPYKVYYSAAWSRTGRKGPYAHYYVQIQPSGSFVGAGFWNPEAEPLSLLRRAVDRQAHKLKKVLMDPKIRKECLAGVASDEKKVVTAFCKSNAENALKTKPKGYEADHPNIELLRLRNWALRCKLKDDEVVGPSGLARIAEVIAVMTPYVTYLNSIVMPDPDQESSDDEDEDEDDDNSEDQTEK